MSESVVEKTYFYLDKNTKGVLIDRSWSQNGFICESVEHVPKGGNWRFETEVINNIPLKRKSNILIISNLNVISPKRACFIMEIDNQSTSFSIYEGCIYMTGNFSHYSFSLYPSYLTDSNIYFFNGQTPTSTYTDGEPEMEPFTVNDNLGRLKNVIFGGYVSQVNGWDLRNSRGDSVDTITIGNITYHKRDIHLVGRTDTLKVCSPLPIFATKADADNYINNGTGIEKAINHSGHEEVDDSYLIGDDDTVNDDSRTKIHRVPFTTIEENDKTYLNSKYLYAWTAGLGELFKIYTENSQDNKIRIVGYFDDNGELIFEADKRFKLDDTPYSSLSEFKVVYTIPRSNLMQGGDAKLVQNSETLKAYLKLHTGIIYTNIPIYNSRQEAITNFLQHGTGLELAINYSNIETTNELNQFQIKGSVLQYFADKAKQYLNISEDKITLKDLSNRLKDIPPGFKLNIICKRNFKKVFGKKKYIRLSEGFNREVLYEFEDNNDIYLLAEQLETGLKLVLSNPVSANYYILLSSSGINSGTTTLNSFTINTLSNYRLDTNVPIKMIDNEEVVLNDFNYGIKLGQDEQLYSIEENTLNELGDSFTYYVDTPTIKHHDTNTPTDWILKLHSKI